AAAAGVSVTLIGFLALAVEWSAFGPARPTVFASMVGMLCFSGIVINATLADFWVRAAREQQRIVATIRNALPELPTGSTLLLYGACPYDGPGIVFESPWDISGVVQMMYKDSTARADVVSPQMSIGEDGVTTQIYGVSSFYPYVR